ncbi:hypothetical protein ZHAS_00005039 [Anopheles sinensis]|uniref:Uncharacterized protein n=1 Tax=Anopheles sinensis TaxID=74873 RepID=A0A084VID3_ANOSI|nr:hypothetical protein ZHAS_00005039 [Anopheles sinensis]
MRFPTVCNDAARMASTNHGDTKPAVHHGAKELDIVLAVIAWTFWPVLLSSGRERNDNGAPFSVTKERVPK